MAVTEKDVREQYEGIFKVAIFGPAMAGKSALRACVNKTGFPEVYDSTIGAEFFNYVFDSSGKKIKLQIWDTAGQERFRGIIGSFFSGANAVLLCCDLTDSQMWEHAKEFLDEEKFPRLEKAMVVLVGTKMDDKDKHDTIEKNKKILLEKAPELKCECRFTSAKTQEGVTALFAGVAQQLIAQKSQQVFQKEEGTALTAPPKNILNIRAKYIKDLENVWKKTSGDKVEKALEILEDYTKDFRRSKYKGEKLESHWNLSALYRFFSGHWNRHYIKELSEIHNSPEKPQNLEAIIEQLEEIKKAAEKENKFNSQGDLAAIIAFLSQKTLPSQENDDDISKDFTLIT